MFGYSRNEKLIDMLVVTENFYVDSFQLLSITKAVCYLLYHNMSFNNIVDFSLYFFVRDCNAHDPLHNSTILIRSCIRTLQVEIRCDGKPSKKKSENYISNLWECRCCVTKDYLPGIFVDVSYARVKLFGGVREARRKYWRRENMSENLIWDR